MKQEDILHLASLARIELSQEEIDSFPKEIEDILAFVGKVQEIDTSTAVVRDMKKYNTLREDIAYESPARDAIIDAFPQKQDNYLEVTKILSN